VRQQPLRTIRTALGGAPRSRAGTLEATIERARTRVERVGYDAFMRWPALPFVVAALVLGACSLRGTSQLSDGLGGGGSAGEGGTGGTDAGGSGGTAGMGGSGGSACAADCDDDGQCDDLMTSSAHCGVCDVGCSPGPCVQGACVIAEDSGPNARMTGVASDTNELFFSGTDGGVTNIFRMPLGGGTPQSLVPLGVTVISDVHVSAANIYVVIEGMPTVVATGDKNMILNMMDLQFFDGQGLSRVDGADVTVCWTMVDGARCTFNEAAQTPIDLMQPTVDVAVGGGSVYITTPSLEVHAATTDGNNPPVMLATVTGAASIAGIDVAQGVLYVAADNGIWTLPTTGDVPQQLTTESHTAPFDLVVDQGRIYVTTLGDQNVTSRLYRASTTGGPEEVLYDGGGSLVAYVEVRNEWVYFTSVDEARLYRRHVDAPAPP
jgi:hypothetical protein